MLCQVSTDIKWISSLKHILLNLCSSENRQTKKIQAQCLGLINPCSPAAGPSHLCCGQTHLLTDTELCHDTLANTSPYTSRAKPCVGKDCNRHLWDISLEKQSLPFAEEQLSTPQVLRWSQLGKVAKWRNTFFYSPFIVSEIFQNLVSLLHKAYIVISLLWQNTPKGIHFQEK